MSFLLRRDIRNNFKQFLLRTKRTFTVFDLIILAILSISLLLFTFYQPPLQKPDEEMHFQRIQTILQGDILCKNKEQSQIQQKYLDFITSTQFDRIRFNAAQKYTDITLSNSREKTLTDTTLKNLCNIQPFQYFHQIIISKIVRNFVSPKTEFYLLRVSNLIAYLLILVLVIYIIPSKSRYILYVISFFPVMLEEITKVGYEIFFICGFLLFFAYIVNLIQGKTNTWGYGVAGVLMMVISRVTGIAFLPILLIEPIKNKKYWHVFGLIALFVIPLALNALYYSKYYTEYFGFTDSKIQIFSLIHAPFEIARTIFDDFKNSSTFYLQSMVSQIGWLDFVSTMPNFIWYLLVLSGVTVNYIYSIRKNVNVSMLVLVLLTSIGGIIITQIIGFIAFGAPGRYMIFGVQGRYIMPMFVLIILSIAALLIQPKTTPKYILLIVCAGLFLYAQFDVIRDRYYIPRLIISSNEEVSKENTETNILNKGQSLNSISNLNKVKAISINLNDFPSKTTYIAVSIMDKSCKFEKYVRILDSAELLTKKQSYFKLVDSYEGDYCIQLKIIDGVKKSDDSVKIIRINDKNYQLIY